MPGTGSPRSPCSKSVRFPALPGLVAAFLLLILGACSGSDFAKLGSDFGNHVAEEVFGVDTSDLEEPGELEQRARDFARRTNALDATGAHAGNRRVAAPTCEQVRCQWTAGDDGSVPLVRTISQLFPEDLSAVAKGATRGGVVDFEYRHGDRRTYGYWMTYNVFGLAEETGWPQSQAMTRFGFAGGNLTGSRPSAGATWAGVMIGTAVGGEAAGTRLAGKAALVWREAEPGTVSLTLSDIHDNANRNPWSVDTVRFDDVPVGDSGRFGSGTPGSRVQGGFYGPGHVEAAGIFEQQNIIGSFGAKRR